MAIVMMVDKTQFELIHNVQHFPLHLPHPHRHPHIILLPNTKWLALRYWRYLLSIQNNGSILFSDWE